MTVQKKILDLTGSQYLVQKVKSAINDVDSSLSTHIADTDIHVTTADKTKWNTVTSKANDSDVVHKSGDETVAGFKEFANIRVTNSIKAISLENTTTDLNNCYSDFAFSGESRSGNIQYYYCNTVSGTANISNLPEANAFFLTSITIRLTSKALYVKQILLTNSKTFVRYCNNGTWSTWVNETDSEYVHKSGDETITGNKTFSSINGVEPSSLSLPNIDNRIDISSYITDLTGSNNAYTPTVNGWISIRGANATKISVLDDGTYIGNSTISNTANYLTVMTPVVANRKVYINIMCTSLKHAYFIPCQGNV